MKPQCRLCMGSGALAQVTQWFPVFATSEEPVHTQERRIVCPRCDGEGRYGREPKESTDASE